MSVLTKCISVLTVAAFLTTSLTPPSHAGEIIIPPMPAPGSMVALSTGYVPAYLMGMTIHPDNALQFDFLINRGQGNLDVGQKKEEYTKLVKYFLASLTIPDQDQWVNLSPYEKTRIIDANFGNTQMGRDLLAQDYFLKQITSSLMYPESGLGRKFWDRVYQAVFERYGADVSVPVNTFNKVWIVPDQATVYESGNSAYIIQSHLKVMLEEDYLSLSHHAIPGKTTHTIASKIVKEIILPQLEREVNTGKNFANLRQIVSGMILATWYKKALRESLLGKVYADKDKVAGVNQDPRNNEIIYQSYLKAFKKGVFNFIKEDEDKYTHQSVPRKYFSGGFEHPQVAFVTPAMITPELKNAAQLTFSTAQGSMDRAEVVFAAVSRPSDAAMGISTVLLWALKAVLIAGFAELIRRIIKVDRMYNDLKSKNAFLMDVKEIRKKILWIKDNTSHSPKEFLGDNYPQRVRSVASELINELKQSLWSKLTSTTNTDELMRSAQDLKELGYTEELKQMCKDSLSQEIGAVERARIFFIARAIGIDLWIGIQEFRDFKILTKLAEELRGDHRKNPVTPKILGEVMGLRLKGLSYSIKRNNNGWNPAILPGGPLTPEELAPIKPSEVQTFIDPVPNSSANLAMSANAAPRLVDMASVTEVKEMTEDSDKAMSIPWQGWTLISVPMAIVVAVGAAVVFLAIARVNAEKDLDERGHMMGEDEIRSKIKIWRGMPITPWNISHFDDERFPKRVRLVAAEIMKELKKDSADKAMLGTARSREIDINPRELNGEELNAWLEEHRFDLFLVRKGVYFYPTLHRNEPPIFWDEIKRQIHSRNVHVVEFNGQVQIVRKLDVLDRDWAFVRDASGRAKEENAANHKKAAQNAAMTTPGGIDLNSANMAMLIRRDGRGVPLPLAQQDMAMLNTVPGFEPRIEAITPVTVLPVMEELQRVSSY